MALEKAARSAARHRADCTGRAERCVPARHRRLPHRSGVGRRLADSALSQATIAHYDRHAGDYLRFTLDHDVDANYAAFLGALDAIGGTRILDLGCGVGRDLRHFRDAGYHAVGLDGSAVMAAAAHGLSGCPVWKQDFLAPDLPEAGFDGVFANACLFHVPPSRLPAVLAALRRGLRPNGLLFVSNPLGSDEQGWFGERYVCLYSQRTWCRLVRQAGFRRIGLFHRPPGLPRRRQNWLATLWRRS